MFKKTEEIGNQSQVSKQVVKQMKTKLSKSSKFMEDLIEQLFTKKCSINSCKLKTVDFRFELYSVNNEIIFISKDKSDILFPHLRLLHKFPNILPKFQIDKGGIKYIIGGANVMAPGLTSPGGSMEDVPAGTVVALYAEGKQHALGIGVTVMSTAEIRQKNKDIAVELIHHLNDGLWILKDTKKF